MRRSRWRWRSCCSALVRAFEEYPRPGAATVVLVGLGAGLAIGTRILGGFGALYALGALALIVAIEARRDGLRAAAAACGRFVLRLLPGLLLGYAAMALVWPWGAAEPLNPFRALQYFSRFFEEPWDELFGGALIKVTQMPRSYLPTLLALKLPEMFSALALGGVIGALIGAFRGGNDPNRRAVLLLVALAAALPVAVAVAMRPAMYNGVRHFLFVVPPLAVAGGLAGAWLFDALRRRGHLAAMAAAAVVRHRPRVAGRRYGARASLRIHARSTGSPAASPARASATCSTIGGCR